MFLNTQGYGETLSPNQPPVGFAAAQRPRINADNNGHLYFNTSPDTLYNFNIDDSFSKNGIFELELLYDIGNCLFNGNKLNQYSYVPQTIKFENDKDDFEQFMISIIIMEVEEDDNLYNDRELIDKINRLIYRI